MSTAKTLQLPGQGLRMVRPVAVHVVEGPDTGARFGPFPPPVRVGSAPGNEVVLTDPAVSRHHCALEESPEGLTVRDAGSTNGVWLGGHRVRDAVVADQARLTVGASVLELRLEGRPEVQRLTGERRFGRMLGKSAAMQVFLQTLERLAATQLPVLIEGETGTGKEVAAWALHEGGPRKAEPFVVVDCGAAAPTLIESALFGHEKGAFTGATDARPGAFVGAGHGTIFLDEIGELPLELQPKLLRALEARTVTPLGSHRQVPFSARVVAATHRDLRRMVNEGTFRDDLYFRLAVCPVRIPPLRDRREDVAPLARAFFREALSLLEELNEADPGPEPELDPESLWWLEGQAWSGNVRELRNVLQRAVILGQPDEIAAGNLAPALRLATHEDHAPDGARPGLEEAKRTFERGYLLDLLRRHDGDQAVAAEEAQIHVKSLQRLIRRHGLKDEV
ncbi:MAG: sigma 54-dependent Fis family transcriptional regulator [Deltaproteobacteria bacterium]|nr:sigma 54-dependent Fis family transcriptional regulator [Deltaproteobacteria bacterium]